MLLKFFLKVGLLGILVLCISVALRCLVPFYWHTDVLAYKWQTLEQEAEAYNIGIIGTSRLYRGIDPSIIDKVVSNHTDFPANTFNFALGGGTAGECSHLLDKILAIEGLGWKYIFFELNSIYDSTGPSVSMQNLHTSRNKYWIYLNDFWEAVRNLWGTGKRYKLRKKFNVSRNYFIHCVENFYNVGMYPEFIDYWLGEDDGYQKVVEKHKDGFSAYKGLQKKGAEKEVSKWIRRSLQPQLKKSFNYSKIPIRETKGEVNEYYYQSLMNMIEKCDKKGIKLIYVLPPLLRPETQKELKPLFQKLPPTNRFSCLSGASYPKLYDTDYVYDFAHVNQKGAKLLSEVIANKFVILYNDKKRNTLN